MAHWPPLASVPPPEVQKTIPSAEWDLYIDAWTLLLELRIAASEAEFRDVAPQDESAVSFLVSFYHQWSIPGASGFHVGPRARTLRKLCFLLTRRFLLDVSTSPVELLAWKYLGGLCCCYPSSASLKRLLSDVWGKHQDTISASVDDAKAAVIKQLSVSDPRSVVATTADVRLLTVLGSVLPDCGQVLMAGSDFLDTFSDAYTTHGSSDLRRVLVANVYVGLTSLLKGSKPNLSLLLDQLFSLKASAGVGTPQMKEPTLLSDLICSSDLLVRLEKYLVAHPQKRGQDLVTSLQTYQAQSRPFHHRYQKQKKRVDKGKSRASANDLPSANELHIHKMSLVTQVQDLFPDLGSGYIVRLLDIYDDNPETVVAHLLDDSIPASLQQSLDKSEQLPTTASPAHHDPFLPRPTPPTSPGLVPSRKNVFDSDIDLADLARPNDPTSTTPTAAKGKLRFGRTDTDLTTHEDTDPAQHTANKAAILSALATFDSDDDERDDTYDVADVGGTVESSTAAEDSSARDRDDLDMALFRAFKTNAGIFGRDAATRRSQPRAALKRETAMTDEAIEGWAVMLARDPRRMARLEDKLALSGGAAGGGGGDDLEVASRVATWMSRLARLGGEVVDEDAAVAAGGEEVAVVVVADEEEQQQEGEVNRQRAKKVARAGGLVG
ncbi:ASCC2 family CUE domain-containing protein [Aspergillus candidus]|uniref:CUE domain-containing protein n=1 Tax=Aspergillus candidus TaxID=41067 RepID=A0A2I2FJW9_ASPCN|nr:hypothetical protein BDW47DRAFT_123006 [Aspergillus candidus]PLB40937.1 hypothetical protein BDW47DRAFT_123006 [Aspergillus candidus]